MKVQNCTEIIKMKTFISLIYCTAFFFVFGCIEYSGAFPSVEEKRSLRQDHLEPGHIVICEYAYEDEVVFNMVIQRSLNKNIAEGKVVKYYAKILCLPSFEPESVVAIYEPRESMSKEPATPRIVYVVAQSNIWRLCSEDYMLSGKINYTNDFHAKAQKIEKDFPLNIAENIYQVWKAMILNSKYGEGMYEKIYDDSFYVFSCNYLGYSQIYAETRASNQGLPNHLIKLGELLIDYCKSADKDVMAKKIEEITQLTEKIKDVIAYKGVRRDSVITNAVEIEMKKRK